MMTLTGTDAIAFAQSVLDSQPFSVLVGARVEEMPGPSSSSRPALARTLSTSSSVAGLGGGVRSPPPPGVQRFGVRSDVQYDPDTQTLTAVMELPGVAKEDITEALEFALLQLCSLENV